jgi:hypothetical protein
MDKDFNWEEAQKAIAAYLEAKRQLDCVQTDYDGITSTRPDRPSKLEGPEEWEHYLEERSACEAEAAAANKKLLQFKASYDAARRHVCKALPRNVWIRYQDLAVGVRVEHWGGAHDCVVVHKWQDVSCPCHDITSYD